MDYLIGFVPNNDSISLSGGKMVLKKLVELLCKFNQKVYVLHDKLMTHNSILIKEKDINNLDKNNLVIIYPEIIPKNPYDGKHIVRWILSHTKNNIESTWGKNDIYYYYNDFFKTNEKKEKKFLICYDLNLDKLINLNKEREGYCHIYRTKISKDQILSEKYNSEDLFIGHKLYGLDFLVKKFNEKKYFLTYNDATYYSVMAALCGCISIILSDDKEKKVINKIPTHKYGIAYGFNDVKNSQNTINLLRPHLEMLETQSINTIKNFIKETKNINKI